MQPFHFRRARVKKKRGRQLADVRNATTRRLADKVFQELWKAWHD